MSDPTEKRTNPKQHAGDGKLPYGLWPETATALGCLALLDGSLKYGRANWRAAGVQASTYYNAARRHLTAWFEGEEKDPDSGLDHLAHALACLAIIVDSRAMGNLYDDRNVAGGYRALVDQLTSEVNRVKANHAHRDPPKHYTIADSAPDVETYKAVEIPSGKPVTDPAVLAALRLAAKPTAYETASKEQAKERVEPYVKDPQAEW